LPSTANWVLPNARACRFGRCTRTTIIRTEHLELLPLTGADFDVFYETLIADPVVMRFYHSYRSLTDPVARRAKAEHDFFGHFRIGAEQRSYIAWGLWSTPALAPGATGFVGWCGVTTPALEDPGLGPELQYMLGSKWHGRGLALEAARAVVADAFNRHELPQLHAVTDGPNVASRKIAERLGFTPRGQVKVYGSEDMFLYTLDRPVKVLETERLVLTQLADRDAEFIRELLNEPTFIRFIGDRGVRTTDDARRYIQDGPVASYARHGFGLLRVGLKDGDTPIGICGVLKRDTLPDPDLGFSLLPAWWSNGYAHEAGSAVMHQARGPLALGRIVAIASVDNEPSIRLLDKLGFRFERMIRLGDDPSELRLFSSEP